MNERVPKSPCPAPRIGPLVAVLLFATFAFPVSLAAQEATPSLEQLWKEMQQLKRENLQLKREVEELRASVAPTSTGQASAHSADPPPATAPATASAHSADPPPATAPATASARSADPPEDAAINTLRVYGTLRGQIAQFDDSSEIQDASSRVGFQFTHGFAGDKAMFVGGEFGLNFLDSGSNLSLDPNGSADFESIQVKKSPGSFAPRLGYLGFDLARAGKISLGKQAGVYRDIADWPDQLDVLSGKGTLIFSPSGTDGGEFGTGRADNAIIYRNSIGALQLGAQVQLNAFESEQALDSYGMSLRYPLLTGLTVGVAWQRVSLEPESIPIERLRGLDGDPDFFAAGFNYENGPFALAGIYARQHNGDFADVDDAGQSLSVFYGAEAADLMGSYDFGPRWTAYAGYSQVEPDTDDVLIDRDFRFRHYTFGLQYSLADDAARQPPPIGIYFEAQVDDSIDANGESGSNILLMGLRYRFDRRWSGPG